MTKHLWEVEHAYYCEGPLDRGFGSHYKSWADFIDEEGESDPYWNMLFRWDWREDGWDHAGPYNGDDYYRNGNLQLFFMGQRKGIFRAVNVSVCRADEPAVIAYLKPRWEHMRELWAPLVETE
ncbi:hypothetical protein [Novosphingobium sp. UBA1939]|uniref:hypothetical protein n=1 Tax=Novosphingobium sp. UBA1939 TaxID=1946982 RepID=UPI0025EEA45E|nr:hypothetical protein [Novosphingobium sp. UBA1939]